MTESRLKLGTLLLVTFTEAEPHTYPTVQHEKL